MTTLVINGQKVEVSDNFTSMTPEEQARAVDEIAQSMGATPAAPDQSPAGASGMANRSAMSSTPEVQPPERGIGQMIYDNVIGDASDGVDSYGEQLGRGLNEMGRAGGAGVARGAASLAGLPGTARDMNLDALAYLGNAAGIMPESVSLPRSPISGAKLTEGMSNLTGGATDYKGDTAAGKLAGTIGEFVPGGLAGGGAKLSNILRYIVAPGVASEGAGRLTEGTTLEPWARMGASILAPLGLNAIQSGVRAAGGLPRAAADPERLKLAATLDDFGVPITAGQRLGADKLRAVEGATETGKAIAGQQADDFTAAALKTIGASGPRATPEVLKATSEKIGAVFDDVVKGVDITPDKATLDASAKALETYRLLAPKAAASPLISSVHQALVGSFRSGNPIAASTLKSWRTNLSKLTTSADEATRTAAREMMDAVDDAMAASLTTAGRTGDIARLSEARSQWRSLLAIEGAAAKAGEDAAVGIISPARLASELTRQGKTSWTRGTRGDIADLSRAGVGVMSPLPTVAPGAMRGIEGLPRLGGMSMGGAMGAATGSPLLAGLLGLAGYVAPDMLNAARAGPLQGILARMGEQAGTKILDPRLLGTIPGALAQ
jgi:hypothetical protein